jgi:hypothetical protein
VCDGFGIIAAALTTLLGYGFVFGLMAIYSVGHMTLDVDDEHIPKKRVYFFYFLIPFALLCVAAYLYCVAVLPTTCCNLHVFVSEY